MSVTIFKDVEEALSREVRRITFNEFRTEDKIVLQDVFDPFTGDIVSTNIEPNYYDSSADTNNIQYPHFFIRLLKTREDRFTGRIVPEWQNKQFYPVQGAPGAYKIIATNSDGTISSPGNLITTSLFTIRSIVPGYLIRVTSGNNIGTYIIDSVTPSNSGPHSITVSNSLITNLPDLLFDTSNRIITFTTSIDLNTIKIGDIFTDIDNNTFNITGINTNSVYSSITIDGSLVPNLGAGSIINRTGNVFLNTDSQLVTYLIMDPTKPILIQTIDSSFNSTSQLEGFAPKVPIDSYYLIRIDSKERATHIEILNRVWEEFNPPRTALPIIERSELSAEQLLKADIPSGGSTSITVSDNTKFNIGDSVFIFDDFTPVNNTDETFQRPFESIVINKASVNNPNDTIIVADTVPDTYITTKNAKIVSNCDYRLWMFHFVDHLTKDVEGAQYWVHEFTFWVQIWVDRLEAVQKQGTITSIDEIIEDLDGNVILE